METRERCGYMVMMSNEYVCEYELLLVACFVVVKEHVSPEIQGLIMKDRAIARCPEFEQKKELCFFRCVCFSLHGFNICNIAKR